jgi:hypothetical protein
MMDLNVKCECDLHGMGEGLLEMSANIYNNSDISHAVRFR